MSNNYDFQCSNGHKRSLNLDPNLPKKKLFCLACGCKLISREYIEDCSKKEYKDLCLSTQDSV